MRPLYETQRDLDLEKQVAQQLAEQYRLTLRKLPAKSSADWGLMRGDLLWGVVEVKVRRAHYDAMMLSLAKVQALREYAVSGLQARVIFATPRGVYAKRIGPEGIDGWIGLGGRTDRGDEQDTEPVVFFGDLKIGGQVVRAEKEPMQRLFDSDPAWFDS